MGAPSRWVDYYYYSDEYGSRVHVTCADYDASVVVDASVGVGVETVAVVALVVVVVACYEWNVVDDPGVVGAVVEATMQQSECCCVDDCSYSLVQWVDMHYYANTSLNQFRVVLLLCQVVHVRLKLSLHIFRFVDCLIIIIQYGKVNDRR